MGVRWGDGIGGNRLTWYVFDFATRASVGSLRRVVNVSAFQAQAKIGTDFPEQSPCSESLSLERLAVEGPGPTVKVPGIGITGCGTRSS